MSQQGQLSDSTTASADIEFITGDSGGAQGPDGANNFNILGGINTTVVGTANTQTINQDNAAVGTGQTVGAVTADLITVAAGATPGCYQVEAHIAAFEAGTPAGGTYEAINGVRTTGAAATLTGTTDSTVNEEAALVGASVDIVVSGNNYIVRATGVAALTIEWSAKLEYVFAS